MINKKKIFKTQRQKTIFILISSLILIFSIYIYGSTITEQSIDIDFSNKNLSPCTSHIFGTDYAGRDMFTRTMKALNISLKIGFISTIASIFISILFMIALSIGGKKTDTIVTWIIDAFLSLPNIVFLILISLAVGKGTKGVIIAVACTHWTSLTRIIRAEIKQIKNEDYIKISKSLGKSKIYIALNHILPSLIPQIFISSVLLFPHAILHEASISFLGFGLSISTPSIGIILSESMQYILDGYLYLAFFPGLMLLLIVLLINKIGEGLKQMIDPYFYNI